MCVWVTRKCVIITSAMLSRDVLLECCCFIHIFLPLSYRWCVHPEVLKRYRAQLATICNCPELTRDSVDMAEDEQYLLGFTLPPWSFLSDVWVTRNNPTTGKRRSVDISSTAVAAKAPATTTTTAQPPKRSLPLAVLNSTTHELDPSTPVATGKTDSRNMERQQAEKITASADVSEALPLSPIVALSPLPKSAIGANTALNEASDGGDSGGTSSNPRKRRTLETYFTRTPKRLNKSTSGIVARAAEDKPNTVDSD